MKIKNLVLGVALLCSGLVLAQEKGDIKAFAGMSYNFEYQINGGGVTFGVSYTFLDKVAIAPSYSYYFTDPFEGMNASYTQLNLDARYYFVNDYKSNVFGLVGFTQRTMSFKEIGSRSRLGSNIGVGASYDLNKHFSVLAQLKMTILEEMDPMIVSSIGVQYAF